MAVSEVEVDGVVFPPLARPPAGLRPRPLPRRRRSIHGVRGMEIGGNFIKFTAIGVYLQPGAAVSALAKKWAGKAAAELASDTAFFREVVTAHQYTMAPLLFKDMRSLSCSSPASTAICPSLERQPMVRAHKAVASPLCQVPTEPRSQRQDGKKGQHRAVANGELVSPVESTRYLLSGRAGAGAAGEIQEVEAAAPGGDGDGRREEPAADVKNTNTQEQVVVLKVSLHCKACAGKVKKHLSKMEGVRSFSIDFTAKKVTVVGDMTPLGVLSSVSKVKNAQIWPQAPPQQPAIAA